MSTHEDLAKANAEQARQYRQSKSADKYYASGQRSALHSGHGNIPGPKFTMNPNDKTADKYYANSKAKGTAGPAERPAAAPGRMAGDRVLIIAAAEVPDALAYAMARLANDQPVNIVVPGGETALLNKVRASLEIRAGQGQLTRTQLGLAKLSYNEAITAAMPTEPPVKELIEVLPADVGSIEALLLAPTEGAGIETDDFEDDEDDDVNDIIPPADAA